MSWTLTSFAPMLAALQSMINIEAKFESDGFVVVDDILNDSELCILTERCESEVNTKVGTRNLLSFEWANELAQKLIQHEVLKCLMPKKSVAVQCNYFSKDIKNNWYVTLHRDLSIPVKNQNDSNEWRGWSEKEGVLYVQPPKQVLAKMVAVRLHLEDNNSENGALEVVAGSHKNFTEKGERRLSLVTQGGALIMRPLILHSSTKLKSGQRRVLHFVFGPEKLPNKMEWANAM